MPWIISDKEAEVFDAHSLSFNLGKMYSSAHVIKHQQGAGEDA